jgi:hypothetical protein
LSGTPRSRRVAGRVGKDPTALFLILLGSALLKSWTLVQSAEGLDYYQFWVVGRALRQGDAGDVYSNQSRDRLGRQFLQAAQEPTVGMRQRLAASERPTLQTYATPLLYSVLGSLTSGNYELDYAVFQLLSLAAGVGAVAILGRLLGYSWLGTLAAAVLFSDWFEPFLSDVRVGNVNRLELGLVALFLGVSARPGRARHVLGGALLAFGVLFKPNLVFVVPLLGISWLLRRQLGRLAAAGIGFVLGSLLVFAASSAVFRSATCWTRWIAAGAEMPESITAVTSGNFAVTRLVADVWGPQASVVLATAFAVVTGLVVVLSERRRRDADPASSCVDDARVVALGCLVWLLSAPLVWEHYLLLAVPAAVLALRPAPGWLTTGHLVAAAATVMLMLNPLQVVGLVHGAWQMASASVLGVATLWLVLLLDVYQSSRPAVERRRAGQLASGAPLT